MSHNIIDHHSNGLTRVATQYTESTNFLSYLAALLKYANELENVLDVMERQSDIDVAEGVNLDTIGEIVGISRNVPNSVPISYFGFDDSVPAAVRFGEQGNLSVGARFREEKESAFSSSSLADPEYRQLIRAKIIKNHSRGQITDVVTGLNFLYGTDSVSVHDNYDMTFNVSIGRELTLIEQSLLQLDILPRPMGVEITQFSYYINNLYFGFSDQVGALGFAEEGFDIGGIFSEEF